MRILVTNDDGIDSPGLMVLATMAREAGHEVVVAAPAGEYSGTSAALTAVTTNGKVTIKSHPSGYAVTGAPAYIVVLAFLGVFGEPPELVLSGINPGANAGRAVLHSGTVGAALTAASRGARAMAVSLDYLDEDGNAVYWETAGQVAASLLDLTAGTPAGTALNLNVPNRPQVASVRRATLAPFGQIQVSVLETGDGFVRTGFLRGSERPEPGTDLALLAEGCATVTLLRPPSEVVETVVPRQRSVG